MLICFSLFVADVCFHFTRLVGVDGVDGGVSKTPLYVITPTYSRPSQRAELTRLSQALSGVENVVWIVVEAVFSTLIGRGMSRLGSHWSRASDVRVLLRQQSYARKNPLVAKIPPTRGICCSSLVLYGMSIVGFHALKGSIIDCQ